MIVRLGNAALNMLIASTVVMSVMALGLAIAICLWPHGPLP
ncbi:hypothetical protein FHS31_001520 [Sphingomonas vulcanisoli]|uniref:Uncharacterized protein n=1 Tax=Sphingomonas vulcanisoli TaxID=1658060 RepID=A0ABX0TTV4_9SPHN|nr:hypothetical protein [Sphingomonas vulcanisoli]NIJ07910.1 hypothetical protein [Sphingomonas vulcanisoli]